MSTGNAAASIPEDTQAGSSTRASSFYAAMRIMPLHQRRAMYEIYQYCRVIDDIADEEQAFEERLEQLQQWRTDIDHIYAGKPPAPLQGLARVISDFSLQKEDLIAVIDGIEMDVRGPIYAPDCDTLILYCDRVACAVGRLSVRVFGMREEDGLALAHHLGLALQLTNILRDIDEDAVLGRLYLPKELLDESGISHKPLTQALAHSAIHTVCCKLAHRASEHFGTADVIMKRYERKHIRTPRIMSQAYHSILTALMERGFSYPRQPVRLSKIKLGYILVRNILF